MIEINAWSFCKSRIWGPSKIPALIFHMKAMETLYKVFEALSQTS